MRLNYTSMPVCLLSKPKRLRKICGSMRSQVYRPWECIIVDSLYLPKDRHGHSKAILIVNAASSKLSNFHVTNLKFESVRQVLKHLLCCTVHPRLCKADQGTEYSQKLSDYLAKYNISLESSAPYHQGSTREAETSIHLATIAWRAICLTDYSNWADTLPLIVNSLNQTFLYQTLSRNSLFYNPLVFQNHLNINGLIFPEHLFEENRN